MVKLDQKEKEILHSVERGDWESVPRIGSERKRFQTYAEETFKKTDELTFVYQVKTCMQFRNVHWRSEFPTRL